MEMKLFEPKKKTSLKEKVLVAERREMNAMADSRSVKEKEYKQFLVDSQKKIQSVQESVETAERIANERIHELQGLVGALESKKKTLEESADEKLFQEKRNQFYKLEEEVIKKRDSLNERLADLDKSKVSLAFIIQEHEESERELREDKARFNDLRKAELAKIVGEKQVLEKKAQALNEQDLHLQKLAEEVEKKKDEAEAQKQANTIFRQTLEAEDNRLRIERKALKDAYAELAKSRERILGRNI